VLKSLLVLFGIFHGFGFASVLQVKGLRGEYLSESILGFNLGVSLGVVTVTIIVFAVLYLVRNRIDYLKWMRYSAYFLALVSLYWFIERATGIDFIIDNYIGKAFGKVFGLFHHHH
jgi:hypothetical protein